MTGLRNDFYVYALFCEDGTPFYIGKGCGDRWNKHEREARQGRDGHRFHIIRRMQAAGIAVPKIKLHQGLPETVAHDYECALIAAIGRDPLGPLVNQTAGGDGVSDPSLDTRRKMSTSHLGKKQSPEAIARTVAALIGRPVTMETRAKIAASNKGKTRPPEVGAKVRAALTGRTLTSEHKANIRASQVGKKMKPDAVAKTAAAHRGRTRPAETSAKMKAAWVRRRANGGGRHNLGRKATPDERAKMRAGALRRWAAVRAANAAAA
jgi:NUMOD3 motif